MNLKNLSKNPVCCPGLPLVEPGQSIPVTDEQLAVLVKNKTVKLWAENGVIALYEDGEEPAIFDNEDDDVDEDSLKEALVAELAELDVSKTTRSSVESLEAALREALVEKLKEADVEVDDDADLDDLREAVADLEEE